MSPSQRNDMMRSATTTVADIDFLSKSEEFARFMDQFKFRADMLADEILHGELSPEEREAKRQFRLGIMEVLRWPIEAKNSSMRVLKQGERS